MKLSISNNTAKVLSKVLPLALEPPKSNRQHLTYVKISDIDGVLTFTATNGYVAFRIGIDNETVSADIVGDLPMFPIMANGNDLCKALGDIAKNVSKCDTRISLAYDDHTLSSYGVITVTGGSSTVEVFCADIEQPDLAPLLIANNDSEPRVLFNGKYLTDIVKAATLIAGDSNLVTVDSLNTSKPGKITANGVELMFTGIIMPYRQDSKVGK